MTYKLITWVKNKIKPAPKLSPIVSKPIERGHLFKNAAGEINIIWASRQKVTHVIRGMTSEDARLLAVRINQFVDELEAK